MNLALVAAYAAETVTIVQSDRTFRPGEVTISAGDTLAFSNQDEFIHQIYVDSEAIIFDSAEQPPGETVTVQFPAAGDFEVHCHIHPKMRLVVHVK